MTAQERLESLLSHNTLVVAGGVAAVGVAAAVVGCFGVRRRRALVGDAAAHATLPGIAAAFALTGRRELWVLLAGAALSAIASLGALSLIRRHSRTRDDAATAIVLGVSYGAGIAAISGLVARGVAGSAGLEAFLLGSTAALTLHDSLLVAAISAVVVALVLAGLKEATLVAFDPEFAAAAGWPVGWIDAALVALTASMVVAALPTAGAVLVTAMVVIPPAAARQWTDRVPTMLAIAGLVGLVSALAGVVASALVPKLATGPAVVLASSVAFLASLGARLLRTSWRSPGVSEP
jgi:manganese/zinc/iron transport system permease protein